MKFKNIIINSFLVIISCVLTLLAFEGILKIFNIGNTSLDNVMNLNDTGIIEKSDNKKLVYTFKPNYNGLTNSYGFRENREYPLTKDPNKKRILALGDSVANGVMVDISKIFLSLLEDRYNEKNKDQIEIINLAVSGYNTIQEVEFFKLRGLQFQPDEVWIFYVLNDPAYDGAEFAAIGKSHLLFSNQIDDIAFLGKLRKHSNLWKIIEDYFLSKEIKNRIDFKIQEKKVKFALDRGIPTLYDLMHLDEYFTDTKNSFKEIKELSIKHNFKLKVFICPILQPKEKNKYKHLHTKVETALKEIGIPVFDMLNYLDSQEIQSLKLSPKDELHLSEKGHSVFSDILMQFIEK